MASTQAADPLTYRAGQNAQLERAAAAGHSHVLYTHSPDGVFATAARTARFRPLIDRVARGSGFSPEVLEAMVFLESAGRPEVIAGGGDPAAAAGLAQIVAETGKGFLGMRVDLRRSRKLTRAIRKAYANGNAARARRLEARRRTVDHRFAPAHALTGMVRYLTKARGYVRRNDLAVASYHMGIGNLQGALRAYGRADIPYVRLYFDSAPDRHARAWRVLTSMSDDSRHYYFKVRGAQEIMRLWRTDRRRLAALARLHGKKASGEEAFRPPHSTPQFGRPREIQAAWGRGELVKLPRRAGLKYDRTLGQLARKLQRPKSLYRGLRPDAAATLAYIGRRVRQLSGGRGKLVVTSALRDQRYQRLLLKRNGMATPGYSLHTTGYAFDIAREYRSRRQAAAFEFVLGRLQSRGIIAWIREPYAIHIAVTPRARALRHIAKPKPKPRAFQARPTQPENLLDLPRTVPQPVEPAAEATPHPFIRFFATLRF
jgi:hypothetical protein